MNWTCCTLCIASINVTKPARRGPLVICNSSFRQNQKLTNNGLTRTLVVGKKYKTFGFWVDSINFWQCHVLVGRMLMKHWR